MFLQRIFVVAVVAVVWQLIHVLVVISKDIHYLFDQFEKL